MSRRSTLICFFICTFFVLFVLGPSRSFAVVNEQIHSREALQEKSKKGKKRFKEGELLVRFKKGTSREKAREIHDKLGSEIIRAYTVPSGLYRVKIKKNASFTESIHAYRKEAAVLYAEPNFIFHTQWPNDPLYPNLWGLDNTGQFLYSYPDVDINAPEAWSITTGSPDTVLAVIDTGVDYNHEDLAANVWTNPGEVPGNGIDDDGNGYIDDVHGINAITGTGDPMDDEGHGTHVSGTIAAAGNNGIGVVGVNWTAKILPCKFLGSDGTGTDGDAIECLQYLYQLKTRPDNPVNVIASNNSWGGGLAGEALRDAIDASREAGILFIAAAGNEEYDDDLYPHYPSNYYLPNIISVAALDYDGDLSWFSNYGLHTVHVLAPGSSIYSTTPNNTYASHSGTSMATPHVTGLVGLLASQDPTRDWKTLRNLVIAGGKGNSYYATKVVSGKRLRAYESGGAGSLNCSDQVLLKRLKPSAGSDISVEPGSTVEFSVLHINCGTPNGEIIITGSDGQRVMLKDDGSAGDQEAGDGIYSGSWTARQAEGVYTFTFPGNDIVHLTVKENYRPAEEVPYSYRAITGTKLILGDNETVTITTPFPVHFAGDPAGYTNLTISSNGVMSFTGIGNGYWVPLPWDGLQTIISPYWDNLMPGYGGVYWSVVGSEPNRELVVEWRGVRHYNNTGTITFQAVFFENSPDVLFNYADVIFGDPVWDAGAAATVGVQVDHSLAQVYGIWAPSLRDNMALLFKMRPLKPEAGADQVLLPGSSVTLDGGASKSFTGTIVSYAWEQTAGTPVVLTGADTTGPGFTAPSESGTLTFQLTVTDDLGNSASDSVNVVVNYPPVANAGPDRTVPVGVNSKLDGTESYDPDGAIVGYYWQRVSGPYPNTFIDERTATPTIRYGSVGVITFELTVTDYWGFTHKDTVNITFNQRPVANAGASQIVNRNSLVTLDGSASSDSDGTVVGHLWQQTTGTAVVLSGADTARPTFTAPDATETLQFMLTVTDDTGGTGSAFVSVYVKAAPIANAGQDIVALVNSTVGLNGAASYDPDGSISSYYWTQTAGTVVLLSSHSSSQPTFKAPAASETLTFSLTVTDNSGMTGSDTVNVIVNQPPVAAAGSDQMVLVNAAVMLDGAGSYDPDGTIVKYAWTQTAGTPVILTGADSGHPGFTAGSNSETLTFQLTVTDDLGAIVSDTVNVIVNKPPVANAGADQLVKTRSTVTLYGSGTDPDGYITSWTWTQTAGSPVSSVSGANSPTLRFDAPGTVDELTFLLTVTDNRGATASDDVVITVSKTGR